MFHCSEHGADVAYDYCVPVPNGGEYDDVCDSYKSFIQKYTYKCQMNYIKQEMIYIIFASPSYFTTR